MTFEEKHEIMERARRARAAAVAAFIASAGAALLVRVRRLRRSWSAGHARAALYALNDRTLKDIGLHRSQIDSMFR